MGNRNNAAHLLVLGIPLLWYALSIDLPVWARRTLLAAGGLSSAAIVLSRSRAAWLAGFLVLGGIVAAQIWADRDELVRRWNRALLVVCSMGVVAALVLPTAMTFRYSYAYSAERIVDYKSGTGRGRVIQYRNTMQMVIDYPILGVGPRNWQAHYSDYSSLDDPSYNIFSLLAPVDATPQSDWLAVLAERGILAVMMLLVAAWIVISDAVRATLHPRAPVERRRGLTLLLFLAAMLVLGALDVVLTLPAGAYMSALAASALTRSRARDTSVVIGRSTLRISTFAAAAVTVMALMVSERRIRARLWSGNWYNETFVPERLERAVALEPGNVEERILAARAWVDDGRCDRAAPHLAVLDHYFPRLPIAAELRRICADGASAAR